MHPSGGSPGASSAHRRIRGFGGYEDPAASHYPPRTKLMNGDERTFCFLLAGGEFIG